MSKRISYEGSEGPTSLADDAQPAPVSLREQALDSVKWNYLAQLIIYPGQIVVSVMLSRLLGPEQYGQFGQVNVWIASFLLGFADLGLGVSLVQAQSLTNRMISTAFWMRMGCACLMLVAFLPIGFWFDEHYRLPALMSMSLAMLFPIYALQSLQYALMQRELRFKHIAIAEVVAFATSSMLALAAAFDGFGIWALVAQPILRYAVSGLLLSVFSGWRPAFRLRFSDIQPLWKFGLNYLGFNIFNFWSRQSDKILIGNVLGSEPLGIYLRAYAFLTLPISQLLAMMGSVLLATLSKLRNEPERYKRVMTGVVGSVVMLIGPLLLGLLVVSEEFVVVVFGQKWAGMIPVFQWYLPLSVLMAIISALDWVYLSKGKSNILLYVNIAVGCGSFLLFGIGVWLGSVDYVAKVYALGYSLTLFPVAFYAALKVAGIPTIKMAADLAKCLVPVVLMVAMAWGVRLLLAPYFSQPTLLVLLILFEIITYGVLLHILRPWNFLFFMEAIHERHPLLGRYYRCVSKATGG